MGDKWIYVLAGVAVAIGFIYLKNKKQPVTQTTLPSQTNQAAQTEFQILQQQIHQGGQMAPLVAQFTGIDKKFGIKIQTL